MTDETISELQQSSLGGFMKDSNLGGGQGTMSGGSGGGVHPAIWGSIIGVVIMVCCVVTFYKYWCGRRAEPTEIIQIIRK